MGLDSTVFNLFDKLPELELASASVVGLDSTAFNRIEYRKRFNYNTRAENLMEVQVLFFDTAQDFPSNSDKDRETCKSLFLELGEIRDTANRARLMSYYRH